MVLNAMVLIRRFESIGHLRPRSRPHHHHRPRHCHQHLINNLLNLVIAISTRITSISIEGIIVTSIVVL